MAELDKPIVLITGCAGNLGTALCEVLRPGYTVVGLDQKPANDADASFTLDLTSQDSVTLALAKCRQEFGDKIAAVIHLAAYFDFSGEESPLYQKVNVDGTHHLLHGLQDFTVERFFYASTMLVHEPGVPGHKIDEDSPIAPGWVYPKSKAEVEALIADEATMPFSILRLAGLYNEHTCVPTLAHQIARIYKQGFKSHLYSGNTGAGQAFLHSEDMQALFARAVDRRAQLPERHYLLAGEEITLSYEALQNRIGELLHGEREWQTMQVPQPFAKAGAWLEAKSEPVVPDDFDKGEKPFIRPFMVEMASDHYELDCSKAKQELDWQAEHRLDSRLEILIENLKKDPLGWYKANGITPTDDMLGAAEKQQNPDKMLQRFDAERRQQHRQSLWAPFLNMGLGAWLITSPPVMGYADQHLAFNDYISGSLLLVFSFLALSFRHSWARWGSTIVGLWLLFAPLALWTPSAAGYLNSTIVGILAIGFAVLVPPTPGIAPVAQMTGPTIPPGWDVNPSSWFQRAPIIILAFVGFFVSRYLTAYQLGHIDSVWEPFFMGGANPKNGTEEIITSEVSEAWPVPDAGIGAMTYALEILTGLLGSNRRWRTMPWLVTLFGFMIVPLGVVSITFIIIQPIVIGTWCTLCLIGAAAMLLQIPYSLDELVATFQFLKRRHKAGRPVLKIFFTGDTDDGKTDLLQDDFARPPGVVLKDMFAGGVTLPWSMLAAIAIGIWLMFTRLTLGAEGAVANWDHIIGSLVITVAVCVFAEVARPVRWLLVPLGLLLPAALLVSGAPLVSLVNAGVCGAILVGLSCVKLSVKGDYGSWSKYL
ncbi:vitamin K epoxide reductase family protein [Gilvimarinus sp. DA14]|uniref:vitamin K epoxide reductase family protein n=1 Tax=Gilvimarinus sp. DA14 TaxID=2956798 RepID=UPI0020B675D9|nr:vitamin K epoxide reductase family protein [Gilvimarinus sp. DA14]UTF61731.1 NAD-dependent epimerase/dehydratase family protein [Gilvimarinus sp. DA14]